MNRALRLTYRAARRIAVASIGTTLLLIGVVMIFLPGPALILIPAGLAILALEFTWARNWLRKLRPGERRATERSES